MLRANPRYIFEQSGELLKEHKFSLALKLGAEGARRFKLYDQYKDDFANIRLLGYEAHDWTLAAEKLFLLLRNLSDEVRRGSE